MPATYAFRRSRVLDVAGRASDAVPGAAGAVVMGTGIVAIALADDGRRTLARVLLAIAALAWIVIAVLLAARAVRGRHPLRWREPGLLSTAAGTSVLGTLLLSQGAA